MAKPRPVGLFGKPIPKRKRPMTVTQFRAMMKRLGKMSLAEFEAIYQPPRMDWEGDTPPKTPKSRDPSSGFVRRLTRQPARRRRDRPAAS